MSNFQSERLKKLLVGITKYVLIGITYYIFVKLTGYRIPCISYLLFRFYCPGCGVTRMCVALIEGNFALAFRQNPFVLTLLPLLIVWGLYKACRYIFGKSTKLSLFEKLIAVIVFIAAVVFSVLRNLPSFEFLVPIA